MQSPSKARYCRADISGLCNRLLYSSARQGLESSRGLDMTGSDPSVARNARLIRWLICLMFFTFAMTTDAVGSVIPEIITEFRLSMTAAGSFQYATMAG